jgi:hypothetical protein
MNCWLSSRRDSETAAAGRTLKMPDTVEALPTVAEQNAAKESGKKKKDKKHTEPEFVGPRGHQQPQSETPKP